jgi:glycosyltransferase involved in cell wall biosynthesis
VSEASYPPPSPEVAPPSASGWAPLALREMPEAFSLEQWFAYLLRSDVREILPADDPAGGFLCWWFVFGRFDYRVAPPSPEQFALLLRPSPFEDGALPFLLTFLLEHRADVANDLRAVAVDEEDLREHALAWFFIWGLKELNLAEGLPNDARRWLWDDDARELPRFLHYAWLFRKDLHDAFDLSDPSTRGKLIRWFELDGRRELWDSRPRATGSGVNVLGYIAGELGIGEDARTTIAALDAAKVSSSVLDLSRHVMSRTQDTRHRHRVTGRADYEISLLCMTAFDTARLHLEEPELFRDRYVIGYWPWELDRFPEVWRPALTLVDEIWVSSRFIQSALEKVATKPVLHMPLSLDFEALDAAPRGEITGAFTFLFIFDSLSQLARKNPLAVIDAFRRAFPAGTEAVRLVLKTMNPRATTAAWRELVALCEADRRIELRAETLPYAEVLGMIRSCDAYVSLHRAEGFGRTLAEAMYFERPVIATAWSGSDEVVRPDTAIPIPYRLRPLEPGEYPYGEGAQWAEPDVTECAAAMSRIVEDGDLRTRLGRAAREHVRTHNDPWSVGRRYAERLAEIRDAQAMARAAECDG